MPSGFSQSQDISNPGVVSIESGGHVHSVVVGVSSALVCVRSKRLVVVSGVRIWDQRFQFIHFGTRRKGKMPFSSPISIGVSVVNVVETFPLYEPS